MNVKEYIASGVLESYVLGLLSGDEKTRVEEYCIQYPEIGAARTAFEEALERQLLSDAAAPPVEWKAAVEEKIRSLGAEPRPEPTLKERTPVRSLSAWRWVAAASLVLMGGAIWYALSTRRENERLAARNAATESRLQQTSGQLAELQREKDMMFAPGMKMAALKGTEHAPEANAAIFWDTASRSHDVYLMIRNLPQPASDRQYQLWALLNGQPIDLGVFDMSVRQQHLLVRMKNVQDAQAFAITLEPRGGSSQPTMDSMYVMGSL